MLIYHGSNHCFRDFKISKNLVEHRSTLENEGIGIYFSTNPDTARSYGKYLYTAYLNDDYVLDFREKATCTKYVNQIIRDVKAKTGINIRDCTADLDSLITYMHMGGVSISGTCHEIELTLDSTEYWYLGISESKRQAVLKVLSTYDKNHLYAYMFPYHIKDIGIIKKLGDSIVQIVKRESSY